MSFALAACVVAERFAALAGRATAPGWRPLTDDVPESAPPADAPPPRPFGALLLARLAGEAGLGWLGQEPRGHVRGDDRHRKDDEHLGAEPPVVPQPGTALRMFTSVKPLSQIAYAS